MVTKARVSIWGRTVGAVLWNEQRQRAEFQYDPEFTRSGLEVAPIMMPLSEAANGATVFSFGDSRDETFRGLPGLLSDSLPDRFGDQILNAWLATQKRQAGSANPVGLAHFTDRGNTPVYLTHALLAEILTEIPANPFPIHGLLRCSLGHRSLWFERVGSNSPAVNVFQDKTA